MDPEFVTESRDETHERLPGAKTGWEEIVFEIDDEEEAEET